MKVKIAEICHHTGIHQYTYTQTGFAYVHLYSSSQIINKIIDNLTMKRLTVFKLYLKRVKSIESIDYINCKSEVIE